MMSVQHENEHTKCCKIWPCLFFIWLFWLVTQNFSTTTMKNMILWIKCHANIIPARFSEDAVMQSESYYSVNSTLSRELAISEQVWIPMIQPLVAGNQGSKTGCALWTPVRLCMQNRADSTDRELEKQFKRMWLASFMCLGGNPW